MEDITTILDRAGQALEAARAAGAQAARVRVASGREYSWQTRDGRVELLKESAGLRLSIGLFCDGRYGGYSTSDLRDSAVADFIARSAAMTRLTDPDPAHGLPDPDDAGTPSGVDLDLFDPVVAGSRRERAADLCGEMTEAARTAADRVVMVTASYGESHRRSVLLTSAGFEGTEESTGISLGCHVYVEDRDSRKQDGGDSRSWRHYSDLEPAADIGALAALRAAEMRGAAPEKTGLYPVVIVNYWGDWVTGMLLRALDGAAVYRKMSILGDRLGQPVAPALLSIADEPLLPRKPGSRRFDGEGMATRPRPVIEAGVVKTFFYDCYWARKQGVRPTTGGASNLVFGLGGRTGEQMAAGLERGLFVTDFIGGNFNPTTGDFSTGIRGFLVEDGRTVRPVAEMNLSGNLLDLLAKLEEVGSDPYPFMSILSPAMRFAPLMVSGI